MDPGQPVARQRSARDEAPDLRIAQTVEQQGHDMPGLAYGIAQCRTAGRGERRVRTKLFTQPCGKVGQGMALLEGRWIGQHGLHGQAESSR